MPHRKKLTTALPTFMNQCEGGACGCTGGDVKPPTLFEKAALDAMEALHTITFAACHHSHKKAILEALRVEIEGKLKAL